jgi:hypothetical protein
VRGSSLAFGLTQEKWGGIESNRGAFGKQERLSVWDLIRVDRSEAIVCVCGGGFLLFLTLYDGRPVHQGAH